MKKVGEEILPISDEEVENEQEEARKKILHTIFGTWFLAPLKTRSVYDCKPNC
jgi:hypothetical protein